MSVIASPDPIGAWRSQNTMRLLLRQLADRNDKYIMKPIVKAPNTILTTPAQTVILFDKKLTDLIQSMKEILLATNNPKGVGLAAPQIGEPWRIFITRPSDKAGIRVFINPIVTIQSDELTDGIEERSNKLEGCLSIPNVWGKVKRATKLTLTYQDETGQTHTEEFTGFLSTIIQHETDHTNGVLYTQRVLEQKGKLFQPVKDKEGKEILEEITI